MSDAGSRSSVAVATAKSNGRQNTYVNASVQGNDRLSNAWGIRQTSLGN
jgi:hypothetical protein